MDRSARSRLAPRLLLVFAVLACVFGWGQSIAAAATVDSSPASVVAAGAGAHADHRAAEERVAASDSSERGPTGHGTKHDSSGPCMTSTSGFTSAAVAVSDVVSAVPSSLAMASHLQQAVFPPAVRRAPDVATLCVQRI